jgi:hypothetical protein
VVVDGRVQVDPAGVRLAQQRHRRHRLADRRDRQQRVRPERPAGGHVADAEGELVPPAVRADQPDDQAGRAEPPAREDR